MKKRPSSDQINPLGFYLQRMRGERELQFSSGLQEHCSDSSFHLSSDESRFLPSVCIYVLGFEPLDPDS